MSNDIRKGLAAIAADFIPGDVSDERFSSIVDDLYKKTTNHTFLDPNRHETQRQMDGIIKKLTYHGLYKNAHYLNESVSFFVASCEGNIDKMDRKWAMLRLLLSLSHSPSMVPSEEIELIFSNESEERENRLKSDPVILEEVSRKKREDKALQDLSELQIENDNMIRIALEEDRKFWEKEKMKLKEGSEFNSSFQTDSSISVLSSSANIDPIKSINYKNGKMNDHWSERSDSSDVKSEPPSPLHERNDHAGVAHEVFLSHEQPVIITPSEFPFLNLPSVEVSKHLNVNTKLAPVAVAKSELRWNIQPKSIISEGLGGFSDILLRTMAQHHAAVDRMASCIPDPPGSDRVVTVRDSMRVMFAAGHSFEASEAYVCMQIISALLGIPGDIFEIRDVPIETQKAISSRAKANWRQFSVSSQARTLVIPHLSPALLWSLLEDWAVVATSALVIRDAVGIFSPSGANAFFSANCETFAQGRLSLLAPLIAAHDSLVDLWGRHLRTSMSFDEQNLISIAKHAPIPVSWIPSLNAADLRTFERRLGGRSPCEEGEVLCSDLFEDTVNYRATSNVNLVNQRLIKEKIGPKVTLLTLKSAWRQPANILRTLENYIKHADLNEKSASLLWSDLDNLRTSAATNDPLLFKVLSRIEPPLPSPLPANSPTKSSEPTPDDSSLTDLPSVLMSVPPPHVSSIVNSVSRLSLHLRPPVPPPARPMDPLLEDEIVFERHGGGNRQVDHGDGTFASRSSDAGSAPSFDSVGAFRMRNPEETYEEDEENIFQTEGVETEIQFWKRWERERRQLVAASVHDPLKLESPESILTTAMLRTLEADLLVRELARMHALWGICLARWSDVRNLCLPSFAQMTSTDLRVTGGTSKEGRLTAEATFASRLHECYEMAATELRFDIQSLFARYLPRTNDVRGLNMSRDYFLNGAATSERLVKMFIHFQPQVSPRASKQSCKSCNDDIDSGVPSLRAFSALCLQLPSLSANPEAHDSYQKLMRLIYTLICLHSCASRLLLGSEGKTTASTSRILFGRKLPDKYAKNVELLSLLANARRQVNVGKWELVTRLNEMLHRFGMAIDAAWAKLMDALEESTCQTHRMPFEEQSVRSLILFKQKEVNIVTSLVNDFMAGCLCRSSRSDDENGAPRQGVFSLQGLQDVKGRHLFDWLLAGFKFVECVNRGEEKIQRFVKTKMPESDIIVGLDAFHMSLVEVREQMAFRWDNIHFYSNIR